MPVKMPSLAGLLDLTDSFQAREHLLPRRQHVLDTMQTTKKQVAVVIQPLAQGAGIWKQRTRINEFAHHR